MKKAILELTISMTTFASYAKQSVLQAVCKRPMIRATCPAQNVNGGTLSGSLKSMTRIKN